MEVALNPPKMYKQDIDQNLHEGSDKKKKTVNIIASYSFCTPTTLARNKHPQGIFILMK